MLAKITSLLLALGTATGADVYKHDDLRVQRWFKAEVRPEKRMIVDKVARKAILHKGRYQAIAKQSGCPWFVIAAIHNLECSQSFSRHLHEGSSLKNRTRWHPRGRPLNGKPPFTFEESALDALKYDKMGNVLWDRLFDLLWRVELYNGGGYWKYRGIPSPYLYSYTTVYSRGKYTSDGKYSSTAVSRQVGAAALWKALEDKGEVDFSRLK